MTRITFIGAGSTVFTKKLLGDIFSFPELADCEIVLQDINAQRLHTTSVIAKQVMGMQGANPTIKTTTNLNKALEGADYVINMIQVGGYKPSTVIDFEIPKKYGLRQTIGDTLGIGGIMRALRTIPVLIEMCRQMEKLCPDVLHLNYVNPLAMNCWALSRGSSINTVGLCHSVQGTAQQLANDIGVPIHEIDYLCAGINHMAFYLTFQRDGENLYPLVRNVIEEGRVPNWNRVRFEIFSRLGYFVTESSEHFSEYVPWFIKRDRPDLIEHFNIPLDEYMYRCEVQIKAWEYAQDILDNPDVTPRSSIDDVLLDVPVMPFIRNQILREFKEVEHITPSNEYAPLIINSIETGHPRVIYGNVPNNGLITNLPNDCIVEVPCHVDHEGVKPNWFGDLPPHLAALMQTNINVQTLTVEAALTGKREHIYHAAMLDPHSGAELSLDQIWAMVDELITAHGDMLPEYR
jgi:alpha-galactosidase